MTRLEADAMCTALVCWPKDSPERFALLMEHNESEIKLYFFVTRENVVEILNSLTEMVGYDA